MGRKRPSSSDNQDKQSGPLHAAGGMVGFVALGGLALAVLAAVVLLPACARLAAAEYLRDGLEAGAADTAAAIEAYDRLLAAAKQDEVLARRLARSQLGLLPEDEVVVIDPAAPPPLSPGVLATPRHRRPDPPPVWLVRVAGRLERPATRRGLLILAGGAMLAAMLLFGPLQDRRN